MIEVAAGIIADAQGRVLLMQRLPGKHLAGLWEFPGGKLEADETIQHALARELREELGVEVHASEPLISIPWHYPDKSVRLHALRVSAWSGEPQPREGHPLRWVALRDIDVAVMPAADAPIVSALRLPVRYAITKPGSESTFCTAVRCASPMQKVDSDPGFAGFDSRPPLVQLRMPDASRDELRRVAACWVSRDPSLSERLLLNHDIDLARELGLGVHLRASQLRELRERPLPAGTWVGASCHDIEELELAAGLGADFATLSPVRATASHPGATTLGWETFARLVCDARLPVYALGGVTPADLARTQAAGAQGVAGIRAF